MTRIVAAILLGLAVAGCAFSQTKARFFALHIDRVRQVKSGVEVYAHLNAPDAVIPVQLLCNYQHGDCSALEVGEGKIAIVDDESFAYSPMKASHHSAAVVDRSGHNGVFFVLDNIAPLLTPTK